MRPIRLVPVPARVTLIFLPQLGFQARLELSRLPLTTFQWMKIEMPTVEHCEEDR